MQLNVGRPFSAFKDHLTWWWRGCEPPSWFGAPTWCDPVGWCPRCGASSTLWGRTIVWSRSSAAPERNDQVKKKTNFKKPLSSRDEVIGCGASPECRSRARGSLTSSTRLKPPIPRVQMMLKSFRDTLEKKSASACSLNKVREILTITLYFNLPLLSCQSQAPLQMKADFSQFNLSLT